MDKSDHSSNAVTTTNKEAKVGIKTAKSLDVLAQTNITIGTNVKKETLLNGAKKKTRCNRS